MMSLRTLLRKVIRKHGYQIQKYPFAAFSPIPVLDLSVQLLMAVRGDRLNFIQVGANDGKYGDPLHRYILKYPWHGILVEPQPDICNKLRENYAAIKNRLIFENIAIAPKGLSPIAMYRVRGRPNVYEASVVSANPKIVARQSRLRPRDLERFFVSCTTLNELVRKYSMSHIDVLQIDAEGCDYEVLKTLDLSETSPLIVQFEHGQLTPQKISGAVDYLNSHGYRVLYGGYQIDTLALHRSFPLLVD
jgi:FkbM family methyltransferase